MFFWSFHPKLQKKTNIVNYLEQITVTDFDKPSRYVIS